MEVELAESKDTTSVKKRPAPEAIVDADPKRQKVETAENKNENNQSDIVTLTRIHFPQKPKPYKTKPLVSFIICIDTLDKNFGEIKWFDGLGQATGAEIPFPDSILVNMMNEKGRNISSYIFNYINVYKRTAKAFMAIDNRRLILACGFNVQNDDIYFPVWQQEQKAPKTSIDVCVICMEKVSSHVILPCMHVCLCDKCVVESQRQNVATCPKCRSNYTETRKLYF